MSISSASSSSSSLVPRRHCDARAARRELARDVGADPASAAGDQRNLSVKLGQRASISSSDSGFSSDERSPGSSPNAFARTARRTIFALRVFGSAPTQTTRSGLNALPSSAATAAATSSAVGLAPGLATQKSHAVSPFTSCGMPTAAASATIPDAIAADSSSAGPIRLPAMFSVSSLRPCRNQ